MKTWLVSDTHFYHANIISYCNRPWASVREMNKAMTESWNEVVGDDDIVYHLGDVCFGPKALLPVTLSRLRGHKRLILGNHDRSAKVMVGAGFEYAVAEEYTVIDGVSVFLKHKPQLAPAPETWREKAEYHLCGHVHEKWARVGNVINVGVDVRGFKPVSLEQLLQAQ